MARTHLHAVDSFAANLLADVTRLGLKHEAEVARRQQVIAFLSLCGCVWMCVCVCVCYDISIFLCNLIFSVT